MDEKYKSWLVSLDSDNFTMYIKTWFAFLASVHELVLSHSPEDRKAELLAQKGDGVYLGEYRKKFLAAIPLNGMVKQCIAEVYGSSREIVRKDYPEYYFVTYYKKIVEENLCSKRDFGSTYCHCRVDGDVQKDALFVGLLFDDRPKVFKDTFGKQYLKLKVPLLCEEGPAIVDSEESFYRYTQECLVRKLDELGAKNLPEDRYQQLSQIIQRTISTFRVEGVYDRIFRQWIPDVNDLVERDAKNWFYDFCYSLRNVMFHRVIDPFDPRWSDVIKASFQGLRELLLENIKVIETETEVEAADATVSAS